MAYRVYRGGDVGREVSFPWPIVRISDDMFRVAYCPVGVVLFTVVHLLFDHSGQSHRGPFIKSIVSSARRTLPS